MHRPSVGILALILLTTGTLLWAFGGETENSTAWVAACWRIGLALAALWLALPQLRHVPMWLIVAILFVAIVVARQPRVMLLAVVVAIAFSVLKPIVVRAMSGR